MSTTKYPVRLAEQTDDEKNKKMLKEKSDWCPTTLIVVLIVIIVGAIVLGFYLYKKTKKNFQPGDNVTNVVAAGLRAGTKIPSTITEISSDALTSLNSL